MMWEPFNCLSIIFLISMRCGNVCSISPHRSWLEITTILTVEWLKSFTSQYALWGKKKQVSHEAVHCGKKSTPVHKMVFPFHMNYAIFHITIKARPWPNFKISLLSNTTHCMIKYVWINKSSLLQLVFKSLSFRNQQAQEFSMHYTSDFAMLNFFEMVKSWSKYHNMS
jgi:hypothetical protein